MAHFYYADISPDTFKIAPNRVFEAKQGRGELTGFVGNHCAIALRFILNLWDYHCMSADLRVYFKNDKVCIIDKEANKASIYDKKVIHKTTLSQVFCFHKLLIVINFKSKSFIMSDSRVKTLSIFNSSCELLLKRKGHKIHWRENFMAFVRFGGLYIINKNSEITRIQGVSSHPTAYVNNSAFWRKNNSILLFPDIVNRPDHKYKVNSINVSPSHNILYNDEFALICEDGKTRKILPLNPKLQKSFDKSMEFIFNNHLVYNDINNNIQSVDLKTMKCKCIAKNIIKPGANFEYSDIIDYKQNKLYSITENTYYKFKSVKDIQCEYISNNLRIINTGEKRNSIYTFKYEYVGSTENWTPENDVQWYFDDGFVIIFRNSCLSGYIMDAMVY